MIGVFSRLCDTCWLFLSVAGMEHVCNDVVLVCVWEIGVGCRIVQWTLVGVRTVRVSMYRIGTLY